MARKWAWVLVVPMLLTGCKTMQTMKDSATGMLKSMKDNKGGMAKAALSRDVGKSDPVSDKQKAQQRGINKVLKQFQKPGISATSKFPVAWIATNANRNGHALKTGARMIVGAKANVYGTYLEIYAYDPKPEHGTGQIWVDKAEAYFQKKTKGEENRYAVNGNYIIYFEDLMPENAKFIEIFKDTRL